MKFRSAVIALAIMLFWYPQSSVAQTTQADDMKKAIDSLNETQKAILRELQDIKRMLAAQQAQAPRIADPLPTAPMDVSKDPVKGAANAKVALIEFSDYQCPYCGRYDKDSYPQIVKDYVDTGKVKYVWRDLPLPFHPNAEKAAEAAHCAGEQGKFWEMHDRLFANQQTIAAADLPKHAEALQLNATTFQQCLDTGRFAAGIKKDVDDANAIGIGGTPTFLIGMVQPNGTIKVTKKLVGAQPYDQFKAALENALTP
jgi:protein-disulfide isomerase